MLNPLPVGTRTRKGREKCGGAIRIEPPSLGSKVAVGAELGDDFPF